MTEQLHKPVLLKEVLDGLDLKAGQTIVDATLGFGGHSTEILKKIGSSGRLIGIEQDESVLRMAAEHLNAKNIFLVNANFETLSDILKSLKIDKVNGFVFDLGVSSFHFDKSGRGFSFRSDEPLDMRLSKSQSIQAKDLVNGMTKDELADLIYNYGGEGRSRQIAKAIVEERRKIRIETTEQLAQIIARVIPQRGKINPATRTFQALRIAVNDELNVLEKTIPRALQALKKGGRIAIISFHSGEDRIVKQIFKEFSEKGSIKLLTKKPIISSLQEVQDNPRSRSAKLRLAEVI
jgi:16S rRNA (cytosine1402-N4)-methyltransferase